MDEALKGKSEAIKVTLFDEMVKVSNGESG
jgi:hypothetical protein